MSGLVKKAILASPVLLSRLARIVRQNKLYYGVFITRKNQERRIKKDVRYNKEGHFIRNRACFYGW